MPFSNFFGKRKQAPAPQTQVPASRPAVPAVPNNRPQNLAQTLDVSHLGRVVDKVTINCKLEGINSSWSPKWCIVNANNTTSVQGALYFELQFNRPRDVPLEFVKVRFKFGKPSNGDPVPYIEAYAPGNTFSGPPMVRTTGTHRNVNPQGSLNVLGQGGSLSGLDVGRNDQANPARCWVFSSQLPPASDGSTDPLEVEFTYTHGWEDDHDGLHRKFRTAVILNREDLENIAMSVQVEARPLNSRHRTGPPQERKSGLLGPQHNTEPDAFAILSDSLEATIKNANMEMSSTVLGPRPPADQTVQDNGPSNAAAAAPAVPQAIQGTAVFLLPAPSQAVGQPQGQILASPPQASSSAATTT